MCAELILQTFRHSTYVPAHSPTLPSLYLRHSSFSNPSVASPTSQFILQPFFRFSYVTGSSLTSSGELPMAQTEFNRSIAALRCQCSISKSARGPFRVTVPTFALQPEKTTENHDWTSAKDFDPDHYLAPRLQGCQPSSWDCFS